MASWTSQNVVEGASPGRLGRQTGGRSFWANTHSLWYWKSVAKAAGLDMTKPATWQQLIEAAAKEDKFLGVQGQRGESMTVGLMLVEPPVAILENEAKADQIKLGLASKAGMEAAQVISTIGKDGLGGRLPTEDENDSMILFQGDKGSFMVNWPFVWPATNASVKDGTLDPSLIKDIGWTLYPRIDRRRAIGAAARRHQPGRRRQQHPDLAYAAIECIVSPENQAEYFITNGNPVEHRGVQGSADQRGLPDGRHHPRILGTVRAASADGLLQRGLHQPAAETSPRRIRWIQP